MSSERDGCRDTTQRCGACGATGHLGHSEKRDEMVCHDCVTYLQNHGHYPDEDGPERETTSTYEIQGAK